MEMARWVNSWGQIYGFPNNADQVLGDQRQNTTSLHGRGCRYSPEWSVTAFPQDGRYKYLGGALTLDKGSVSFVPV
jgi:hypothetical protein